MTQRINFFNMFWRVEPFFDMTERIDFLENESNIWTLFEHDSFSNDSIIEPYSKLAHRIEFFKVILSIEFFFWKKTQRIERIEPFLDITQRIEFFFLKIWLKELNFLFLRDSNTWTFLKKWTLFFFRTQSFFIKKKKPHRIEFLNPTHIIEFFLWIEPFNFLNMTQRIEPFNFLNMTQRFEPFFQNITQRIELFLKRRLKELNSFWMYASKNLTLFPIRLTELIFFKIGLKELNFLWTWLKELNLFF